VAWWQHGLNVTVDTQAVEHRPGTHPVGVEAAGLP
jgi:hypothetical protein